MRKVIIAGMSRLRRLVVSDRWFFITCRLLPRRRILSVAEFATLAQVIDPAECYEFAYGSLEDAVKVCEELAASA